MLVFRVGGSKHIDDLSGEGARLGGGRWNRVGVPVLYTGSSIALSAWEYWVHLKSTTTLAENSYSRITIELPENSVLEIKEADLPSSWPKEGEDLFAITDKWIKEGNFLCMKVPSAVIDGEFNYIINPQHPLALKAPSSVKIIFKKQFSFDSRAFGKKLVRKKSFNQLLRETIKKYFPWKLTFIHS